MAPVGHRLPDAPGFNMEAHRGMHPWDDFETFTIQDVLSVTSYPYRLPAPRRLEIVGVYASVGTAPTGASIIVDLNRNGTTTIFTNQGRRPQIAAGAYNSGWVSKIDLAAQRVDDFLTLDVDQVGSTIAGADLTVCVYRRFVW